MNLTKNPNQPTPPPPPPEVLKMERTEMADGAEGRMERVKRASKLKHIPLRNKRNGHGGPILRFTPYAWAKLLAFRDYGPTEIAGFGVSTGTDPLLIEDFVTVRQSCTMVTVAMEDESVANYFDQQVDQGRKPEQFLRVWLHTHPGESAQPSGTDEETFERVFGQCDWAIMAILARGGQTYARLRFGVGPGAQLLIPVEVDFTVPFPAADHEAWQAEYELHVMQEPDIVLRHLMTQAAMDDGSHGMFESNRGGGRSHDHRSQRWHQQDAWDIHDMNDLQALAELEAEQADELQQRAIREEMEVGFDSR